MLYLITGKLLSLKSYSLYFSVCHLEDLETIENLFGWFLLEHVFEEYETTPGKLFIIYEDFRTLIGATNPAEAAEGTIRKLYATSMGENAVHGSDSDENAEIESNFHFSGREKF